MFRSNRFSIPLVLFAALAAVAALGCSDGRPSRVPISGKVLIDGQPLKYGNVRFTPENARMSGGMLDSEGRFSLSCFERDDGAVIGLHRVTVAAGETLSPTKVRWHAPRKYSDLGTSGLTQEIKGPDDNLVINLTWDGGKPFDETVAE
jgi:hypothetical protein